MLDAELHVKSEHDLPECFVLREDKTWEELHEWLHREGVNDAD